MIAAFIGGLTQFLTPTHLLAVVALGLLAGQDAKRMPGVALAAFALGLLTGSIAIAFAIRETPAALALLATAAIAGIIVVGAWPLPQPLTAALAFATGTALALNAPPRALTIPSAIAMQLGTGIAALAALAFVAFIAHKAERPWQRIGVRVIASWVTASTILVLALRLTR